jgi:hypothetical protein
MTASLITLNDEGLLAAKWPSCLRDMASKWRPFRRWNWGYDFLCYRCLALAELDTMNITIGQPLRCRRNRFLVLETSALVEAASCRALEWTMY